MFDMNNCKEGDRLISKHGMILVYVGRDERLVPYPHKVQYPNGAKGSRTDDGRVAINKPLEGDHDIVGFAEDKE